MVGFLSIKNSASGSGDLDIGSVVTSRLATVDSSTVDTFESNKSLGCVMASLLGSLAQDCSTALSTVSLVSFCVIDSVGSSAQSSSISISMIGVTCSIISQSESDSESE